MSELENLQIELKSALEKCGRDQKDISLIVASKYFSVEQILTLYKEGQRDFGENKVQDALKKIEALPKDIHWHFIGHLQKNKVGKIIGLFDLIHSVDSFELASKISDRSEKVQPILLRVNTSKEATKMGFTKDELLKVLSSIENLPKVDVKGLMTMAPLSDNPEDVKGAFSALREIKDTLKKESWHLSMGMSQDFVPAIEAGSNYVRIGRRLLPR